MTVVINLFGGPGCGKSTGAAYVFSILKMLGINAELVTEFAKDKTWEKNMKALDCQPYVFGKQVYRMDRCKDDVEVIVTDSPLILSITYNKDEDIEPSFTETVIKKFNEYDNLNFVLQRTKPYNPKGRNQTEEESIIIDTKVQEFLSTHHIPYTIIDGSKEGYDEIVAMVVDYIKTTGGKPSNV